MRYPTANYDHAPAGELFDVRAHLPLDVRRLAQDKRGAAGWHIWTYGWTFVVFDSRPARYRLLPLGVRLPARVTAMIDTLRSVRLVHGVVGTRPM